MSETTPTTKVSSLPLVVAIVVAVAGLAAAGVFFSQSRSLQSRLDGTTRDLQQIKSELEQAKGEITSMEPLAAKAREMPIAVSFRKAVLGSGYVLTLQNKTTKSLSLGVTVADANSQKTKSFRVVVDGGIASRGGMFIPAAPKEIGYAEGWAFASGDSVEIVCAGFDPIRRKIP